MKQVLIVEDEVDIQHVLKVRIEQMGHNVISAPNGKEALGLLKKMKPDLIISDFMMPVMDGYDFYKKLKNHRKTAEIPVMILTARDQMEQPFRIFGVDEFMSKPFEMDKLMTRVGYLLDYSGMDFSM